LFNTIPLQKLESDMVASDTTINYERTATSQQNDVAASKSDINKIDFHGGRV
jgi:hypothetical protein